MPETPNTREVNDDTEVIDADKISDGDEPTEEELDETVIPPVEEDENPEPKDEENQDDDKSTPESSPEEPEPEADKTAKEPAPSQQPKPVEGETPREKALRLEVQRLKGLRRKEAVGEIANATKGGSTPPSQAVTDRMAKLRETYSEEEIRAMEEAIDVLAESKGYVKASTSYQQTVNDNLNLFIEENPEYKPENDPEDVRWERFQTIVGSGVYNLSGKTPQQLQSIFKKIKQDVDEELGEPATTTKVKAKDRELRQNAAQNQKIKSVSHSGGTKSAPSKKTTDIDPSVRGMFKGFDDDDLV